ncbi:MAG TPA: hypothetical protein VJ793_05680 [Anaerolineae bacterium]|nr:hypothetical protein [Anaerolineae bacterium]
MQMQLINTALSAEQIETLLDKLKTDAITAHRPFTDDELRGAYDILRLIVSAQVTYGLLMSGDITSRWSTLSGGHVLEDRRPAQALDVHVTQRLNITGGQVKVQES